MMFSQLASFAIESLADAMLVAQQSAPSSSSRLDSLVTALTVFVLAMWVGFEVITKVPPTLHTPLTSGSNAISGITLVGAVVAVSASGGTTATFLGFLATVLASINVVGGFLVTHRMLSMFRRKD